MNPNYHLRVIALLVCFLGMTCHAANNIVIDGIKYTLQKDNTLTCEAANKDALIDVELSPIARINGIDYYLEEIKAEGFKNCKNLKSIVIPNTVKTIGAYAFKDCSNLETIVMPDEAEAIIFPGNFGVGQYGIFKGCTKLVNVSGHNIPYPKYVVYDAFYDCTETPFYKTITEKGSTELIAQNSQIEPFSTFAESRLKRAVEEWQVRKQYETKAQWNNRVNEDSRQSYITQTLASLRHEYISKYSPQFIKGHLGNYETEYEFFPVDLGKMGTIYVSVPKNDAENIIANWSKVSIEPIYGIMDDKLSILACNFSLDGKEYHSARSYSEDDFTPLFVNITPLQALINYEDTKEASSKGNKQENNFIPDTVDINIPSTEISNPLTFAVIIGNENYQRVAPVEFAANDAMIFEKYCEKTLGIPQTNIRTYYDATFGDINAAIRDLKQIASTFDGNIKVIVYYAGHGIPDESNRNAYILPVDAAGEDLSACYPLSTLYDELGALNAESIIVFVDACFSGSLRGDGMLASARGIRLKPKALQPTGNLVVFSATSEDQSALPYKEKGHGIFTYFLLEKLNSTKGDISIGELTDYISKQVGQHSIVVNRKLQTPTVSVSRNISERWRDLKLK